MPKPYTWNDQLFARFRAGCDDAFNDLYAALHPGLIDWLTRRYGVRADIAEEAAAEAWARVAACRAKGKHFRRVERILCDRALAAAWQLTAQVKSVRPLKDDCPVVPASGLERLIAAEQIERLLDGLAVLSERQREIMRAVYVEGMTLDEAAAALNCGASTVDRELAAARSILAARIAWRKSA